MDQFRESLDRIGDMTDEELKTFGESVRSEFDTVQSQDPTPDVVQKMTDLVSVAEHVKNESDRRVQEAATLADAAAEAQARMAGLAGEEAPDVAESDTPAEAEEAAVEEDDAAPTEGDEKEADDELLENPSAAAEAEEAPAEDEEPKEAAAPAAEEEEAAPKEDDAEDNDPSDDKLSEEDKKKLKNLSSEESETTSLDNTVESELSAEPAEATVTETVAENAPEAEASAEAQAEAELATEEVATEPETASELSSDETTAQTEEPVTASSTPEFQAPEDLAPEIAEETEAGLPMTITAGADIPGVSNGSQLPNFRAVAQAILDRKKAMGRTTGGNGEHALVASVKYEYPADRLLDSSDFDGNRAKIDAVTKTVSAPGAIVAAGGFLAPVPVRYELFGLGTTERPVKDSLAVFGADRGGLRYITPPVLTDLNGAVSLWTKDDDIAALTDSNVEKPCIRVAAGAEVTVEVEAIPLCLTFGNMGARSYPELVERHTELGMILHARFAETRLLTRIGSLSTQVSATASLGAVRDILGQVDRAASGYRNRHRIADDTPLRVIFPSWFKDALRSDIAKQLPGDGLDDTLALAESQINSWFAARFINVTWTIDGETGQIQGAQAAGALNNYPSTVIWYLFAEGTFLFLDQGTLDLGLVRDSMLNSTNDYKIFLETFEGVAKVGVESLRVSSELKIRGSASATTTLA